MKHFINAINFFRRKIFTDKNYDFLLFISYLIRNMTGYIRGILVCFSGKVKIEGKLKRALIIGASTKIIIRPSCTMVLLGRKRKNHSRVFRNNTIFPKATTIGLTSHYLSLDPPACKVTKIDLDNNGRLILESNTIILPGCYITANHGAEVFIGENSYLSHEVIINSRNKVYIGKNVMIGHQSRILDYDAHEIISTTEDIFSSIPLNRHAPIIINDDVWLGLKTTILKGVTIGRGAIIGANSCVTADVPPNSIAVGVPARVIKENITWKR